MTKALDRHLIGFTVALLTCGASAQVSDTPQRTSREIRTEAVQSRALTTLTVPAQATPWRFTGGIFGDRDQYRNKTVATPFSLSYVGIDRWRIQLLGDGYTRISAPGQGTLRGVGDFGLNVYRQLADQVTVSLGAGIPAKGDVGSRKWSQKGKLSFAQDLGSEVSLYLQGSLSHTDRDNPAVSNWSQGIYAEISYQLPAGHSAGVGVARGHTEGLRGATEVSTYYNHVYSDATSATVSLARGITSARQHTAVGLDLNFKY